MHPRLLRAIELYRYGVECADRSCSSGSEGTVETLNFQVNGAFEGENCLEAV